MNSTLFKFEAFLIWIRLGTADSEVVDVLLDINIDIDIDWYWFATLSLDVNWKLAAQIAVIGDAPTPSPNAEIAEIAEMAEIAEIAEVALYIYLRFIRK